MPDKTHLALNDARRLKTLLEDYRRAFHGRGCPACGQRDDDQPHIPGCTWEHLWHLANARLKEKPPRTHRYLITELGTRREPPAKDE